MEESMKRKQFLGFAVMTVAVIITLASCASLAEMFKTPEFPPEFRGTWKREGINNTLTITANTYRLSHQSTYWVLEGVTGDTYRVAQYDYRSNKGIEVIRFVNGNLIIDHGCNGTGLDYCVGTWIRQ